MESIDPRLHMAEPSDSDKSRENRREKTRAMKCPVDVLSESYVSLNHLPIRAALHGYIPPFNH